MKEEILEFWLKEVGKDDWYIVSPEVDEQITSRFLDVWKSASKGKIDAWFEDSRGALSGLILLDQFPRNMFRGQREAFSTDSWALEKAKKAVEANLDLGIPEPERQFFYLPFMHSEDMADQNLSVELIQERMPVTGESNLSHAIKHREVIEKFGRFPSRNLGLGRVDTSEELSYREAGGYMS